VLILKLITLQDLLLHIEREEMHRPAWLRRTKNSDASRGSKTPRSVVSPTSNHAIGPGAELGARIEVCDLSY
jgi:hypothetical protein